MRRRIQQNNKNKRIIHSESEYLHSRKQKRMIASVLGTFCAVILITSVFGGFYTSAHNNRIEEPVNFKYYKSIIIESGDSLWSIAEEYMTDDCTSVAEYVDGLKNINHIYSEYIQEGQSLIVPYNDTNFIK